MKESNITQLLQQYFSGDPGLNWELLKAELLKPENAELRKELIRLAAIESSDLLVDEQKMWSRIEMYKDIGKNKRSVFRNLYRCAAAAILFISVGGGIWFLSDRLKSKSDAEIIPVMDIEPGKNRASLILSNGKQIDLSETITDTTMRQSGTTIIVDASKTVSYQQTEMNQDSNVFNTIIVPRGGEYRLILADGTSIWLNSDSELKFPVAFPGCQRKVYLNGEAYFQVAKDADKPFVVEVNSMNVEVLGTEFNINAYPSEYTIRTTLVNGKVKVSDRKNGQNVVLRPDQQAEFSDGNLSVKEVDASAYTSWVHGKFYFEASSLESIAVQLQRWYDIDFFFTREDIKKYEFTGVIRRDYTANEMLRIIEKTTSVKFEIKGRTVVVR